MNERDLNRITELENALGESLRLQAHYAELLNLYDGGCRRKFVTIDSWLKRLKEVKNGQGDKKKIGNT